ncbi:MAG: RsmG family class I SAM-dependent methyltransferase, partial [Chloroflexota bacterium]|nr:RsmG family class I SAM-dependent methyltransferase [Chloroflexota bacterium]
LGSVDSPAASPRARRSYEAHARLLRDWNAAINLTAIREPVDIALRHICDSLSAVPRLTELTGPGATLLDIGSGGGYPGLPLAAALPLARLGLLDSVGKKARFLDVAGAAVAAILGDGEAEGAPVIEAIPERAEDLAEEPDQRGAWDIVTARAVGSLAEVIELSLPLTREGGWVVAWKREEERGGLRAELRDAGSIIRATGGGRPEVVSIDASFLPGHRLVVVPKERPTPASYPRPAATRKRRKR